MKIALVTHNVVRGDGQGRVNLEIARYALARKHEVYLVAANADEEILNAGARLLKIQVIRRPVLARVAQFVQKARSVVERLRVKEGINLVIANGYTFDRPHDINLCQFVHSAWLKQCGRENSRSPIDWAYQQLYSRFNASRERVAYRQAGMIITPSQITADELAAVGMPATKVRVIPNGIDPSEFHDGGGGRTQLGLPEGVPLLVFAGDIRTNRKGLRFVLHALVRSPGVHLAVIGRSEKSPFVSETERLGLSDRVRFLGYRRDVGDIMRAGDLFVFPSQYEPFGMVVGEAMACGLPVITSAATGASEVMSPECGTVLKDPTDVETLARTIQNWLADPAKRQAAAEHGRAAAAALNWKNVSNQYIDLFERTAGA